jgi:hypothetical protein
MNNSKSIVAQVRDIQDISQLKFLIKHLCPTKLNSMLKKIINLLICCAALATYAALAAPTADLHLSPKG